MHIDINIIKLRDIARQNNVELNDSQSMFIGELHSFALLNVANHFNLQIHTYTIVHTETNSIELNPHNSVIGNRASNNIISNDTL